MTRVNYRAEIFKEGDQYAAIVPELNVSSFGDTPEEASASLQEAVELFLGGCKELGTLEEALEESGQYLRLRREVAKCRQGTRGP